MKKYSYLLLTTHCVAGILSGTLHLLAYCIDLPTLKSGC